MNPQVDLSDQVNSPYSFLPLPPSFRQVALVVVDGVSEREWNDHVDCFPRLQCMMPELPAKLLPSEVQGTSLLGELFAVPFSLSEAKVVDHFSDRKFNHRLGGGEGKNNNNNNHYQGGNRAATRKDQAADQFRAAVDEIKMKSRRAEAKASAAKPTKTSTATTPTDVVTNSSSSSSSSASSISMENRLAGDQVPVNDDDDASYQRLLRESLLADGVVTWVDVRRRRADDVTCRLDLLMTEADMAREGFPLPYALDPRFASEFVPLFDSYKGSTLSLGKGRKG